MDECEGTFEAVGSYLLKHLPRERRIGQLHLNFGGEHRFVRFACCGGGRKTARAAFALTLGACTGWAGQEARLGHQSIITSERPRTSAIRAYRRVRQCKVHIS